MKRFNNLPSLKDRRKELRQVETPQEKIIWWHLKNSGLGYKFKRQHSIGGYILDFYCAKIRLAIELDGEIHNNVEAKEYDKNRDNFLREFGCRVVRFSNFQVDRDVYKVLTKIRNMLEA